MTIPEGSCAQRDQRDDASSRADPPSCLDVNGQPGAGAGPNTPNGAEERTFFSDDGRHDGSLGLPQSYGGVAQSRPSGSFGLEPPGYLETQRYNSFFDGHMTDTMSLGPLDGSTLSNLGPSSDGTGRENLNPSSGHVLEPQYGLLPQRPPGFTFLSPGCLPGMLGEERPHPMSQGPSSEGLNPQTGLRPDNFLGRRDGDQVGSQVHPSFSHYNVTDRHDVLLNFHGAHVQQTLGSSRQHPSGLGSSGYLAGYGQLGHHCDVVNSAALRPSFDHVPHVLGGLYASNPPADYSTPSSYPSPSKLVTFASSPASDGSLVLQATDSANPQGANGGSGNMAYGQEGFIEQSQRSTSARDLSTFDSQPAPPVVPIAPSLFTSAPDQANVESVGTSGPTSTARLRPRRPPCAPGSTSVLGTLLQRLHAIHNSADCRHATVKTQRKADAIAYAVDQLSSGELLQLLKNIMAFQNTKTFTVSASALGNGSEKKPWDWTAEGEGRNGCENSGSSLAESSMMKTFPMDDVELLTDELGSISGIADRGFLLSVAKWCQQQSPLRNAMKPTDSMKNLDGTASGAAEAGRSEAEEAGQFVPALTLGPAKTEHRDILSGECGKQGFVLSGVHADDSDFPNARGAGFRPQFGLSSRGMNHDGHGERRCCCDCCGVPQAKLIRTLMTKIDTLQQAMKAHVDLQTNSLTALLGSQLVLGRERTNVPFHGQGLSKGAVPYSNATESTKSSSSSETFGDDLSNDSGFCTQRRREAPRGPVSTASALRDLRSGMLREREEGSPNKSGTSDVLSSELGCSPSKRQRCDKISEESFVEGAVFCSPRSGIPTDTCSTRDSPKEEVASADGPHFSICNPKGPVQPSSLRRPSDSPTTDDVKVPDPPPTTTDCGDQSDNPCIPMEYACPQILKAEEMLDGEPGPGDPDNVAGSEQNHESISHNTEEGYLTSSCTVEGFQHHTGNTNVGVDGDTAVSPTPHDQCLLQLQALGMATPHWAEHEGSYQWHRARLELAGDNKRGASDGGPWEASQESEVGQKKTEDITENYLRLFLDDLATTDVLRLPSFPSGVMPETSVDVPLFSTDSISRQAISFLTPYDQDGRIKESWDVSVPRLADSEAGALLLNQISVRLQQAVELIPLWITRLDSYRQSCDPLFRPLSLVPCHLQAVAFSQFFCTYAETSSMQLATLGNELSELVAGTEKQCIDGQRYNQPTLKAETQMSGENKAAGVCFGGHSRSSSAPFKCGASTPSSLGSPSMDFLRASTSPNAGASNGYLSPYRQRTANARFLRDSNGLNSSVLISPMSLSMVGRAKNSLPEDIDGAEFGNEGRSPAHSPKAVAAGTGRRMMLMVCTAKPTAACPSTVNSISASSVAIPAASVSVGSSDLPSSREEEDDCRATSGISQSRFPADSLGATVAAAHASTGLPGSAGNVLEDTGEAMGVLAPVIPSFPEGDEKLVTGGGEASGEGAGQRTGGSQRNSRTPGIQGVVWKPEENAWIAFWQDPTTLEQQVRRFSVTELGEENARKMAVKCRRDADRQLSATVMASATRGASSKDVQLPRSEVPGVYWYRNRNGWVAQWFENGKNKHKFFAASVFGVEGAKQKAIAYRLMKLEEKKLHGW